MKKIAIIAAGSAALLLAGCGGRAPKQAVEANTAAPVMPDTMASNEMANAADNATVDNASNGIDRTNGDRTNGDRTNGDRTNGDRTNGDRTNVDK
jgi:PBP1b-binding outer membrane lipoprotein LpoB